MASMGAEEFDGEPAPAFAIISLRRVGRSRAAGAAKISGDRRAQFVQSLLLAVSTPVTIANSPLLVRPELFYHS
jgi:hypothetical protein